ncbi:flagellar hook-basal body complex protein [bacterium]|nr:flagellar hook-basal body complex protein [bacterium]
MVDRAIYIGYNGAVSQQFGIDVLSNNIANANTIGYRAQRPTFADLFSRSDQVGTETTNPMRTGHGPDLQSIDTLFRQGPVKDSQSFTDLAIQGDGFFVLKDAHLPEVRRQFFTRAGNFGFDAGVVSSGSGNPFTANGQVLFFQELPTYTVLPRLVDTGSGRIVQGYLADATGVVNTAAVTDLTVDPAAKDEARETKTYSLKVTLDSAQPEYQFSLMQNNSNFQLASAKGSFNNNQDRGVLTVSWNADGSGSWKFLKVGQTIADPGNTADFAANTVKVNKDHTFVPGVTFRTFDVSALQAGSFTALVGPYDVTSNSTVIGSVEGVYLGNRKDGRVTINTAADGTFKWSFVPGGGEFASETGSGTFAAADSTNSNVIPGVILKKTAGTALTAGTLVFDTKHEGDAEGIVTPFYDDTSPTTQHTLTTVFKQVQNNEYGVMVDALTEETFAGTSVTTLPGGIKQISTYAKMDPNDTTVKTVSNNATLSMAKSVVKTDTGGNIKPESVRGSYWTQDLSGTIALTINANGSGSWTFTPAGQTVATDNGTIAAGGLTANTTYSLENGNEKIPGLVFTTGSAIAAGTATFESSIGVYRPVDNKITFSPTFSAKITSLTQFSAKYRFDATTLTRSNAAAGESNRYFGNVQFDANGQFLTASSTVPDITVTPNSTIDTLTITPTFTQIQQIFGPSDLDTITYDGNLEGVLTQIGFDDLGKLTGVFTNGTQRTLAQIVLGRFVNPGGLNRVDDTSFQVSSASGAATIRSVEQIGAGIATILPKKLEYSNANLAEELTDLIFFQRAFQFSSRAIRMADELVQNAISMKR